MSRIKRDIPAEGLRGQVIGFPLPNVPYGLNSKNGLLGYPAYVNVVDPNLKAAYSENWSLSLQRSLGKDWVAEANYVASLGRHLYAEYDVNRFDGDLIQNNGHLTRLNSSFGGIDYGQSNMNSSYQGFNAALKNRTSFGLNTQIAYTFGRAIDQQSSAGGGLNVVDVSNLSRERGLADFDVRNKLAISLLWDVPHPSYSSKFLSTLTSGWELGYLTKRKSIQRFLYFCLLTRPECCRCNSGRFRMRL